MGDTVLNLCNKASFISNYDVPDDYLLNFKDNLYNMCVKNLTLQILLFIDSYIKVSLGQWASDTITQLSFSAGFKFII